MKKNLLLIAVLIGLTTTVVNAQWQAKNTGLGSNNVSTVVTTGANVLAGTDAGLYISTDNGDNWALVSNTNLTTVDVKQLAVVGSNVFVATYGSGIYMSSDNGVTWTAKNAGFPFLYACGVSSVGNTIYASMSFDHVYTSIDNGTTWTAVTSAVLDDITVNSIISSGSNLIAASGSCNGSSDEGVYISTDGGATFTLTSVIGDSPTLAVVGSTIMAATQDGVFKSTDNGVTWSPTMNVSGVIDNAISLLANGSTLLVGCPYSVYSTTNMGTSYTDISAGAGAANLSVSSLTMNSSYVFAGNTFHSVGVWRRPLSELGLSLGVNEEIIASAFTVYPNPTNGKFKLRADIDLSQDAQLQVFNLLGESMLNVNHFNTQNETEIDLSAAPRGIYFVQITDGANKYSKKIVVE